MINFCGALYAIRGTQKIITFANYLSWLEGKRKIITCLAVPKTAKGLKLKTVFVESPPSAEPIRFLHNNKPLPLFLILVYEHASL